MTAQEIIAFGIGLAALAYIGWRWVVRRRAATCCGETECPAAKRMVEKL
ncbi:MAG: hypothetical protein QNJ98_13455 [Planctomycetota bacterium]|nr:hypothetical protein [Planctomycetota bacterium]